MKEFFQEEAVGSAPVGSRNDSWPPTLMLVVGLDPGVKTGMWLNVLLHLLFSFFFFPLPHNQEVTSSGERRRGGAQKAANIHSSIHPSIEEQILSNLLKNFFLFYLIYIIAVSPSWHK